MASNVFQPQVAQVDSAVTPKQGVADTSAVDLFADVAKVATEAAFSYTGQQELSDLGRKFGNIVQARQAGGNASMLQAKAQKELNATRANAPWVAQKAEKLYRETFSGGGSTGAFSATPEEKAKADYLEKVEQYRLQRNLPNSEVAAQQISLEENAKAAKIQADAQKQARTYNGDRVTNSNKMQLSNQSVKFMDALMHTVEQGGGTLNNDVVRSLNLSVDFEVQRLTQEFMAQTRDSKTGHVLIDNDALERGLKDIEDFGVYAKGLIGDNTMTKVFTDMRDEMTASNKILIARKMPAIAAINDALGSTGVAEFIRLSEMNEGVAKNLIKNPATAPLFDMAGSFTESAIAGLEKVVVPTPGKTTLTQPEALAAGTTLNDPVNFNFVKAMLEDGFGTESSTPATESMLEQNPDSAAMYWTDKVKAWAASNPPKAKRALDTGIKGLKRSFDMASVHGGTFPKDLSLQFKPRGGGLIAVGDGITTEHTSALRGVYKIFKEHSEFLKQFGKDNGNPDITAKEATEAYLTGNPIVSAEALKTTEDKTTTPNKGRSAKRAASRNATGAPESDSKASSAKSEATPLPEGIDEAQGFTEDDIAFMIGQGKITEDDAILLRERGLVGATEELPDEATMSKEALQLQQFKDKGFTKEEVLSTLEGLGFNKNMLNDRMRAIIEEAYG